MTILKLLLITPYLPFCLTIAIPSSNSPAYSYVLSVTSSPALSIYVQISDGELGVGNEVPLINLGAMP